MNEHIWVLAAAGTTVTKILVDLWRLSPVPAPLPPVLSVVVGVGVVLLLMVADSGLAALSDQTIAQAILAGIVAGGGAVGVTEIQRRAD